MMEVLIKNMERAVPVALKDQVEYEPGKVVSKTLAQRPYSGITLFAFDAGEGINTHAAPGDAMAFILEGTVQITIYDEAYTVSAGEAIVMPVGAPHAVKAGTRSKMLLTLIC